VAARSVNDTIGTAPSGDLLHSGPPRSGGLPLAKHSTEDWRASLRA